MLYNNAYLIEDRIICGTRGWFFDEKAQKTVTQTDFDKLCNREHLRLKQSLDAGIALRKKHGADLPLYVFLHFPPIWGQDRCDNLLSLLSSYNVTRCYFGHIHTHYRPISVKEYEGIPLESISSDHLNFLPQLVR
jgi:predicted phosphohydrolase